MCDKKQRNKMQSTQILKAKGVDFVAKNNGVHLIVDSSKGKIDFWPTTGKYIRRLDGKSGRGVFNMLDMVSEQGGCSACGQYPYLESTGLCGVCTFGEADAQVDLLNGFYEGVIYE